MIAMVSERRRVKGRSKAIERGGSPGEWVSDEQADVRRPLFHSGGILQQAGGQASEISGLLQET